MCENYIETACTKTTIRPRPPPATKATHLESLSRAVVGVEHELGEGAGLGRAIPAVRAVHQDADALHHRTGDERRRLQDWAHVLQPAGRLHAPDEAAHRGGNQLACCEKEFGVNCWDDERE